MVADDGLASVACESRPSRVLMRIAVVVDLLACYFIITEVRHLSLALERAVASSIIDHKLHHGRLRSRAASMEPLLCASAPVCALVRS